MEILCNLKGVSSQLANGPTRQRQLTDEPILFIGDVYFALFALRSL